MLLLNQRRLQTELIDEFTEPSEEARLLPAPIPESHKDSIGIRHASFTWAADSAKSASVTPGGTRRRAFVLTVDDELNRWQKYAYGERFRTCQAR